MRLIDADKLMTWFNDHYDFEEFSVGYISGIINEQPTIEPENPDLSGYSDRLWRNAYERGKRDAQPEIIRCRDCAHADKYHHCLLVWWWTGPDDFCSRAERKQQT